MYIPLVSLFYQITSQYIYSTKFL